MKNEITESVLKKFAGEYENDPVQKAVRRVLYRTKLNEAALVQENEGKIADRGTGTIGKGRVFQLNHGDTP